MLYYLSRVTAVVRQASYASMRRVQVSYPLPALAGISSAAERRAWAPEVEISKFSSLTKLNSKNEQSFSL